MTDTVFAKNEAPTSIVIFGGTGDLMQTKLLPSLLDLYGNGALPDSFSVVGLSRKEKSDTEFQEYVKESVVHKGTNYSDELVNAFCTHFRYVSGSFLTPEAYERIKGVLSDFDESIGLCSNKLFYLAVPPQYYEEIFEQLHASRAMALCDGLSSWSRLLVEKPFGKDLATARALEEKLCSLFSDEQIYRIDHYLAKDAIENIISLRFMNRVLENSWNNEAIESIAIRLLETKDVSHRGSLYDNIGTLRDVGQNHMLQIFALLTMPPPDVHSAAGVRDARAAALEALVDQPLKSIERARYRGYETTPGVGEESQTETYFKLTFTATMPAWRGTTFIFEAGKALDRQANEAVVTFKPSGLCHCNAQDAAHEHRNTLYIQFAPEHHIRLSMWTKKPGFAFELEERELVLHSDTVDASHSPEAYERVLFDCIEGDQTRFVSDREVEASWHFITPILEQFDKLPLKTYEPGSAGPED